MESTAAQALVIVPFPTIDEAQVWADKVSGEYPDEPPLLVTAGKERVFLNRQSGSATTELTFAGGWRAKLADIHSGVVVIARPSADVNLESLSSAKT